MQMNVLVACEKFQRVCISFRERGHNAYSCDIQECSGGHPEWHIKGDVLKLLYPDILLCSFDYNEPDEMIGTFYTCDGKKHVLPPRWDLIIAHPPCTYLSNAGACRLYPRKGELNQERYQKGLEAKEFFLKIWNADCPKICIENPVPSKIFGLPEKTQSLQPYEHGEPYTKKTYLWLKGLSRLEPTNIVDPVGPYVCGNAEIWKKQALNGHVYGKEKSAEYRSKTFWGIARAMAEQWGAGDEQLRLTDL